MEALDPVPDLLVREAVAAARRDQEPLGEDRGGPAGTGVEAHAGQGTPREDLFEGGTVELALTGAEAASGRLMDLPGHLRREPPHGTPAQPALGGETDGDPQAEQVEVGGEHILPRGLPRGVARERRRHLREQPQCQRMAGVGGGERAVRDAEPGAGRPRLRFRQRTEAHTADEPGVHAAVRAVVGGRGVEKGGREVGTRLLPVLGPAGHDEPGAGVPQPARRPRAPGGEAVRERGRHLLGAVEQQHQRPPRVPQQAGDTARRDVPESVVTARRGVRRGEDAPGPLQGAGDGVGHGRVGVPQVGAAQPQGGGGLGTPGTAGGERGKFRGAAGAGIADEAEYLRGPSGEAGELPSRVGPFDGPRVQGAGAVGADRGGREVQGARQVQVTAVAGDGGCVAFQEAGERPFGIGGGRRGQRHGEARGAVRCL